MFLVVIVVFDHRNLPLKLGQKRVSNRGNIVVVVIVIFLVVVTVVHVDFVVIIFMLG